MSDPGPRDVLVQLLLRGGHRRELMLPEDSSELRDLLLALADPDHFAPGPERFFQLPLDGGKRAFSVQAGQVVAVTTTPPVLLDFAAPDAGDEAPEPEQAEVVEVLPPRHLVIDDFLAPGEHADMLAHALTREDRFEAGTVAGEPSEHRTNRVYFGFGDEPHGRLIQNRLLIWLPFVLDHLGLEWAPIDLVESQLTATNDGHYYRRHEDASRPGEADPTRRRLSCVYYFSRDPRPFDGGLLRLYEQQRLADGERCATDAFVELDPRPNRMVIFESTTPHELTAVTCPGAAFGDSRFAVTTWLWASEAPDPEQRQGWGSFRCNRPLPRADGVPEGA